MVAQLEKLAGHAERPSLAEMGRPPAVISVEVHPAPLELLLENQIAGKPDTLHLDGDQKLGLAVAAVLAARNVERYHLPTITREEVAKQLKVSEKAVTDGMQPAVQSGIVEYSSFGYAFRVPPHTLLSTVAHDQEVDMVPLVDHGSIVHPNGRKLVRPGLHPALTAFYRARTKHDLTRAQIEEFTGFKKSQALDTAHELAAVGILERFGDRWSVTGDGQRYLAEYSLRHAVPIHVSVRKRHLSPTVIAFPSEHHENGNTAASLTPELTAIATVRPFTPLITPHEGNFSHPDERRAMDAEVVKHKQSLAEQVGDRVFGTPRTRFDITHKNPRLETLIQGASDVAKNRMQDRGIWWDRLPERAKMGVRRMVIRDSLQLLKKRENALKTSFEKRKPDALTLDPAFSPVFDGLSVVKQEMAMVRDIDLDALSLKKQRHIDFEILSELDTALAQVQRSLPDIQSSDLPRGVRYAEVHPSPIEITVPQAQQSVSFSLEDKILAATTAELAGAALDLRTHPATSAGSVMNAQEGDYKDDYILLHVFQPLHEAGIVQRDGPNQLFRFTVSPHVLLDAFKSDAGSYQITAADFDAMQNLEGPLFASHHVDVIKQIGNSEPSEPIDTQAIATTLGKSLRSVQRDIQRLAEQGIVIKDDDDRYDRYTVNRDSWDYIQAVLHERKYIKVAVGLSEPSTVPPHLTHSFEDFSWMERKQPVEEHLVVQFSPLPSEDGLTFFTLEEDEEERDIVYQM